jgi:hypothetical protein
VTHVLEIFLHDEAEDIFTENDDELSPSS